MNPLALTAYLVSPPYGLVTDVYTLQEATHACA